MTTPGDVGAVAALVRMPVESAEQLSAILMPLVEAAGLSGDRPPALSRTKALSSVSLVQHALLESSNLHSWLSAADSHPDETISSLAALLKTIFCPPNTSTHTLAHRQPIVVAGLRNLLAHLSTKNTLQLSLLSLINDIVTTYHLKHHYESLFLPNDSTDDVVRATQLTEWEDLLSLLLALPTKIANYTPVGQHSLIPLALRWQNFQTALSLQTQTIFADLALQSQPASHDQTAALARTLSRFSRNGFFNAELGTADNQSFWKTVFPIVKARLFSKEFSESAETYANLWRSVFLQVSSLEMVKISTDLFSRIQSEKNNVVSVDPWSTEDSARLWIKSIATLITQIIGQAIDNWDSVVLGVVLRPASSWNETIARVFVSWIVNTDKNGFDNLDALETFMKSVVGLWNRKETFEQSPVSFFNYLTTLLFFCTTYFPKLDERICSFAHNGPFIGSIQKALSSTRRPFRLRSMLLAELLSALSIDTEKQDSIKPLSFGEEIWDSDDSDSLACGRIRTFVEPTGSRKADGHISGCYTFDFSDTGNHEAPPSDVTQQPSLTKPTITAERKSSKAKIKHGKNMKTGIKQRSASNATPKIQVLSSNTFEGEENAGGEEEEEEEEDDDLEPYAMTEESSDSELDADLDDPSVVQNKKKPTPPAYIATLSEYLKASEDVDMIKVGLQNAEALIRRKRAWGTELEVNCIDLCVTLIGLHDNYALDSFEELRLKALTALVVCCPKQIPVCLIEYIFGLKQSIIQIHTMMSALAFGACELAGVPGISDKLEKMNDSHSKNNKPALPANAERKMLQSIGIYNYDDEIEELGSRMTRAALKSAKDDAEDTIPEAAKEKLLRIGGDSGGKVTRMSSKLVAQRSQKEPEANINNFATVATDYFIMPMINGMWNYLRDVSTMTLSKPSISGSGWATLLSPLNLIKYTTTLTVFMGAGISSAQYVTSLAPESLQLAVFGLRGYGERLAYQENKNDGDDDNDGDSREEEVVAVLLELVLIIINGCIQLDGGQRLGRENAPLLGSIADWTEQVWKAAENRGGTMERGARAAAGVILRVESIIKKSNRGEIERWM